MKVTLVRTISYPSLEFPVVLNILISVSVMSITKQVDATTEMRLDLSVKVYNRA